MTSHLLILLYVYPYNHIHFKSHYVLIHFSWSGLHKVQQKKLKDEKKQRFKAGILTVRLSSWSSWDSPTECWESLSSSSTWGWLTADHRKLLHHYSWFEQVYVTGNGWFAALASLCTFHQVTEQLFMLFSICLYFWTRMHLYMGTIFKT